MGEEGNRLGVVIVAYGHEQTIVRLLDRLGEEKEPGDSVVVVDNHPKHVSAEIAERHPAVDRAIRSENAGFGAGCNLGAARLPPDVDLLFFLNPDTLPYPGALSTLRSQAREEWAGWMPLLVLSSGDVNTAGNVLHISGLSWVSGVGEPASGFSEAREIPLLSGACTVIRKEVWDEVGGFWEPYFLYLEDTDLSLRMRLRGYRLGLLPQARIEHDYAFDKGPIKWFYQERNRHLLIVRTWPAGLLFVLLPLLFAVELGLWAVSIAGRRGALKAHSTFSFLRALPITLRTRRQIQRTRVLSSLQFLELMEPRLDTPLVGRIGRSRIVSLVFSGYYRLARAALRPFSRAV